MFYLLVNFHIKSRRWPSRSETVKREMWTKVTRQHSFISYVTNSVIRNMIFLLIVKVSIGRINMWLNKNSYGVKCIKKLVRESTIENILRTLLSISYFSAYYNIRVNILTYSICSFKYIIRLTSDIKKIAVKKLRKSARCSSFPTCDLIWHKFLLNAELPLSKMKADAFLNISLVFLNRALPLSIIRTLF